MARAWGLIQETLQPYFARQGISGAQWGVLRTLQRAEKAGQPPLRLKDLGDRLLIRPPSVTSVVDRLEQSGLVTRCTSSIDLRAKSVQLTARGRGLLARIGRRHPERLRELLGGFRARDTAELRRLMQRMADHLEDLQRSRRSNPEQSP